MIKGVLLFTLLVLSQTYESDGNVLKLTATDFDLALKQFPYMLVKFYAPWCGHCKSLAPIYKQAAAALSSQKSIIKLAQVDCTIHKNVCSKYGIKGYPTVNYFAKGAEPVKYPSGRQKDAIIKWLKEQVPAGQSKQQQKQQATTGYKKDGQQYILTEETYPQAIKQFDYILIKFYAPWCGHCKKIAPIYKSAASKLSAITSKAILASVDCTVHKNVCSLNGIKGYPTLKMFVKGVEPIQYKLARTEQAILGFIKNQIATVLPINAAKNTDEEPPLEEL